MMSYESSAVSPATDWNDERLIRACLNRDEAAWSALIDRYKRLIYSIPIRYGMPPEEAGEIFQQVCVTLLSELSKIKDSKSLGAWLIRVTSHKCAHWAQKQRRFAGNVEIEDESFVSLERADTLVFELERDQILQEAIAELSPRCRELIRMLFFEIPAVPYEQVAKNLRLARGSIGFIRMRCLKKLRVLLMDKAFV
jgi:RNA polymerase sigma factor (sigma-70 family)